MPDPVLGGNLVVDQLYVEKLIPAAGRVKQPYPWFSSMAAVPPAMSGSKHQTTAKDGPLTFSNVDTPCTLSIKLRSVDPPRKILPVIL